MRVETVAILGLADAMKDYGREALLSDLESLILSKKFYTCEELSVRYGVTIQTLKNWEAAEILMPDLRVGKGCVRYSSGTIAEFEKNYPGKKVK